MEGGRMSQQVAEQGSGWWRGEGVGGGICLQVTG